MSAFFYALVGFAVAALLVLAGVLRGRKARHEDGDRVAAEWFTEHSGPDGGAS